VNAQLQTVVDDLVSSQQRLHALYRALPSAAWSDHPGPGRWSAAECVAHLNLTSDALLPLFRAGLDEARARGGRTGRRYRRDLVGWLVWLAMRPSGGLKTTALPAYVPSTAGAGAPVEDLLAVFDRLQEQFVACARAAEGLPIEQVTVVSPFDARVKVNLYAALTLVARHQHRHLLQAERAAAVLVSGTPDGVPRSPAAPPLACPRGDVETAGLAVPLPA
jgi:hypothetical protein